MASIHPEFFTSAAHFRRWLQKHHADRSEVWLGIYKVDARRKGISYKDAVDEALCFGWIDGIRKRFDEDSYVQRFTPRTARSYWSAVNTRRVAELQAEGRMHAAGMAAFERRDREATAKYSFERASAALDPASEQRFRAVPAAWDYFSSEAPWYRRVATHWVISAKKEETRQRRLAQLIDDCAAGRRIGLVVESNPQRRTKASTVRRPKGQTTARPASQGTAKAKGPARTRTKAPR